MKEAWWGGPNGAFWVYLPLGLGLWFGLIGRLGWLELAQGLVVVASAWWLFQRTSDEPLALPAGNEARWIWAIGRYLLGYVGPEVVRSTIRVFGKVVEPHLELHPSIVAVELPSARHEGLILLAYGISLTPGNQVVAIDEQRGVLYVHSLDAPDPEAMRLGILAVYDKYLKEAMTW